jgi:hypothetical protein
MVKLKTKPVKSKAVLIGLDRSGSNTTKVLVMGGLFTI